MSFDEFFEKATTSPPFPFQRRFAAASSLPQFVDVPTGMGKTAMIVVAWLWRRFAADEKLRAQTPLRLVYCLPMRVLVEQTARNAREWISGLQTAGALEGHGPPVYVLMGGEDEDDWDLYPEREAIIVGTQDMLLSRALNRGYAASRARWPIQFGELHNDCLWVFDEIQLMGAGLATTAQLDAFRRKLSSGNPEQTRKGHGCHSLWMSATMRRDWLKTIDFDPDPMGKPLILESDDFQNAEVSKRWKAKKPLCRSKAASDDTEELAREVLDLHRVGSRTIVVVNTVKRACELFEAVNRAHGRGSTKMREDKKARALQKDAGSAAGPTARVVLLHSRFRPTDRKVRADEALAETKPGDPGTIIVSTHVIEAGVDVSATTLFTELAPWASLVQRFGRCNRRGEADEYVAVRWIDVPDEDAAPYDAGQLQAARECLKESEKKGVGLEELDAYIKELTDDENKTLFEFEQGEVIRRTNLIDLFDTTPDLAGNDIDIDRFVREVEDSDVRVFWRHWDRPKGHEPPPDDQPAPRREELCPAPIGSDRNPGFRQFAKRHGGEIWRWSFLDKKWESVAAAKIVPGQVYLVHAHAGGYSTQRGWDPNSDYRVEPINPQGTSKGEPSDGTDGDQLSRIGVWQTIAEHTEEVCAELDRMLNAMCINKAEAGALRYAARWHDRGKVHKVFQNAIDDGQEVQRRNTIVMRRERPSEWRGCSFVAKAPDKVWKDGLVSEGFWRRYDWLPEEGRKHFRHELASALAVLDPRNDKVPDEIRDLVALLVAAHHGKVRLSIRSLPKERHPPPRLGGNGTERRFARGVWDGDELRSADLGGVTAPAVTLSLEPMELGLCEEQPFAGQRSWAERMIRLRDALGPFRLAYLEAILRAADMRASRAAEEREAKKHIVNSETTEGGAARG